MKLEYGLMDILSIIVLIIPLIIGVILGSLIPTYLGQTGYLWWGLNLLIVLCFLGIESYILIRPDGSDEVDFE